MRIMYGLCEWVALIIIKEILVIFINMLNIQ